MRTSKGDLMVEKDINNVITSWFQELYTLYIF